MDKFAEQLVKKQDSTKDTMKRACVIVLTITVTVVALVMVAMGFALAIVLPVCAIWGAWYFLKMLNVEYEYSCTNGVLDIDKIFGQSKRKQLLSVEVKTFTVYGKAGTCPEEEQADDSITTFSALGISLMGEDDDAEEYYAEFEHPEHGKCCLYFNPDSNFREALEPFLSREMKVKLNKR
ncbi:MAG: hypothetical protein E7496_03370 [Ruminococcus sp.]|nr:hypothetical protein [Ruminococcus sp.]